MISAMSKYFLNIYKAHWQRHLKDTLQLKILWKWINIPANYFWINIMKQKWAKIWVVLKSEFFYEEPLLNYFILFLSNKPIFWIKPHVDRIIYSQFIYLFTFWYFMYLVVHPVPLCFFIWTSKTLMRLSIFLWRFTATKCCYYVLIFHETFVPANRKYYSWR